MSESPISLRDETGVERFRGTQSSGGGSQPVQAIYSAAAPATIADGGFAFLPFDNLDSGTELLDRTTPSAPVVLADGVYAVTASPSGNATSSPGGYVQAGMSAGPGPTVSVGAAFPLPSQGMALAVAAVALSAGDPIQITASNFDGGAVSQDVTLNPVAVVKLA